MLTLAWQFKLIGTRSSSFSSGQHPLQSPHLVSSLVSDLPVLPCHDLEAQCVSYFTCVLNSRCSALIWAVTSVWINQTLQQTWIQLQAQLFYLAALTKPSAEEFQPFLKRSSVTLRLGLPFSPHSERVWGQRMELFKKDHYYIFWVQVICYLKLS